MKGVIFVSNGFNSTSEFESACTEIVERISPKVIAHGIKIALAESLTGGLLASEIVRVPGVSAWLVESCVTYTNDAKVRRLGVKRRTLRNHTAVSFETGQEMASGIRHSARADIGISTTGLAGPYVDELGRCPGEVYITASTGKRVVGKCMHLDGSRTSIRQQTVYKALIFLEETINDYIEAKEK